VRDVGDSAGCQSVPLASAHPEMGFSFGGFFLVPPESPLPSPTHRRSQGTVPIGVPAHILDNSSGVLEASPQRAMSPFPEPT
jgi:hypothetical protein